MAILTDDHVRSMWRDIFTKGRGKEHFKGANPGFSGPDLKVAFQTIEDFWEANKVSLKGQMDTAVGFTMTADQARMLGRAWLNLKAQRGN